MRILFMTHRLTFYSLAASLYSTRFNIQKFYILSPYYNYVFFRISDQRAIIVLYSMNWLFD